MPVQQMTFENIVAKEEIAHDKLYIFLVLPQCLYLNSIIVLSFRESVLIFDKMFTKSSAVDLLYVGKGYLIIWMEDII